MKKLICSRRLAAIVAAITFAFGSPMPAHADPIAAVPNPFPEMTVITSWYDKLPPDQFFLPDRPGVWFLTPTGINCGIWTWGSTGCTGAIPGAPQANDHIAWFNGNRAVHHGWSAAIQFPAGQALRPLPPRSYITYESTTCAVTPQGDTYCTHGPFGFMMTATGTWFKGWDDRRSYVCNSYGSCPPG